jgi:hypothetical protein
MNEPAPFDVSALIPWYLNGTLSAAERAQVESYLRESPDAEPQLQLWRAVQIQAQTQESADPGTELGWRRLRAQLRSERRTSMTPWRIAVAASVLLLVGLQTAILLRQGTSDRYAPLSGTSASSAETWRVQVRFVDNVSINEINALLLRLDARVVNGPSALGLYELTIPRTAGDSSAGALRTRLQREPLLQQVAIAPMSTP